MPGKGSNAIGRACLKALCATALLAAATACRDPGSGDLAASVNGERITHADLERYGASRALEQRGQDAVLDSWQERLQRLRLLQDLVDQRLLLQVADAEGVVAADREVDAVLERHQLPYGSGDGFREVLREAGIGEADLRVEIRRRLTVEKLLNREISSRVQVDEDEMRAYYEQNVAAFTVPEQQLHLAQILVTESAASPVPNLRNDDATTPEAARAKIQRIAEELDGGADFEQLALHYSEDPIYAANGGDMGFVPVSALEKSDVRLRRALVALQPGDVSGIVETAGEFRILRLIAIEPAGQREFSDPEVRDSIREVLANRQEQLLRTAYYAVLRNGASIRNHLAEAIAEGL